MKKFIIPILFFCCLLACSDEFHPDEDGVIRTCVVWDVTMEVEDCVSATAYNAKLDFKYTEQTNDSFELYVRNNQLINVYPLAVVPLDLANFQKSGQEEDFVRICIKGNSDCCFEFEFISPICVEETMLDSMAIEEEVMMEDSMAIEEEVMMEDSMAIEEEVMMEDSMAIEEEVMMEDSIEIEEEVMMEDSMEIEEEVMMEDSMEIEEEVMMEDSMEIEEEVMMEDSIEIEEEVMMEDSIEIEEEVMMEDSMEIEEEVMMEDSMEIEEEVMMEDSMEIEETCQILGLVAEAGECNSENSYVLSINFEHGNASNDFFDLFIREDELIGNYPLSELPIRLENFNTSGLDEDYIKVCINDQPDCCMEIEFPSPICLETPTLPTLDTCAIANIQLETGACTSDSTYVVVLNFEHSNAENEFFDIYGRNEVLIDVFPLADLPLQLDSFQTSGLEQDFIRICINDNPDCCMEIEFSPPGCIE